MNRIFDRFWKWYEKHLTLNLSIAAGLFSLQIIHLTWLALHVIAFKLLGFSLWDPGPFWQNIIILVDYTEIPALFSTGLIYVNEIRRHGFKIKPAWYIFSLAVQLLHMFWITDEFVLTVIMGTGPVVAIPAWLAWVAILIDYLELPVIFETVKKLIEALSKKDIKEVKNALER